MKVKPNPWFGREIQRQRLWSNSAEFETLLPTKKQERSFKCPVDI